MSQPMYPQSTPDLAALRRQLAPPALEAFSKFSEAVFAEGTLSVMIKQLIAVAVAHVTQCPYCIRGHTRSALRHGATREQIMEAIWVASEMRAGGAYAHSLIALSEMREGDGSRPAA